jgi:hypothetical protein
MLLSIGFIFQAFGWLESINDFFMLVLENYQAFSIQSVDYSILAFEQTYFNIHRAANNYEYWVLRGTWLQEDSFLRRMHQAMTGLLG